MHIVPDLCVGFGSVRFLTGRRFQLHKHHRQTVDEQQNIGALLIILDESPLISNNKGVPIQNLKNLKAGSITCDTIFYYTGSEMTVTPTVKDMDGNTIDAANYSVVISPSTVRALGNYTMTVTANANGYSGTLTHAFEVIDEPIGIAIDRDYKTNELGYYYTNMPYNSNTNFLRLLSF